MHEIYKNPQHPVREGLRKFLTEHPETPLEEYPRYDPLARVYEAMGRIGFDYWSTRLAIELELEASGKRIFS